MSRGLNKYHVGFLFRSRGLNKHVGFLFRSRGRQRPAPISDPVGRVVSALATVTVSSPAKSSKTNSQSIGKEKHS